MDHSAKDPEETSRAYQKFLSKKDYRKAYRCLEKLLKEFPDDLFLLEEVLVHCLDRMNNPGLARPYLISRIQITPFWYDYALLSTVEAEMGRISKAREYLDIAVALQKKQRGLAPRNGDGKWILHQAKDVIRLQEYRRLGEGASPQKGIQTAEKRSIRAISSLNSSNTRSQPPPEKPHPPISPSREVLEETRDKASTAQVSPHVMETPTYTIPVRWEPPDPQVMAGMLQTVSPLKECRLRIDYAGLDLQRGFDDLLCLPAMKGVERYWYQVETVKKVLKYFHGRVLLCDEVGLGKTIEAGMLIQEYLLRGMVKNVLILTPAPLVSQWKEEMAQKFNIEFVTTDDPLFNADPDRFWNNRFIIASIHTAKGSKHMAKVIEGLYDLVVVDEAHHLKNRNTLAWKLVNGIKKRFVFLLTATPVQNNLIELFNLITLLKPGQFKTERIFKKEYIQRGDPRTPVNKERLRDLLREVMIRNTRSAIDLKLPKRFASTLRLEPTGLEREIYAGITDFVREHADTLPRPTLQLLMREAGSSPSALKKTLLVLRSDDRVAVDPILGLLDGPGEFSKEKALMDLLLKNPMEKKVLFTQYLKSMETITDLLTQRGLPFVTFSGDRTAREKDEAVSRFREEVPLLVSTESGGEGRNLQFCNTLINFDLPWNPMRIEQRIGRLHRIGQTRDVFIFNLSVKETLEDHILQILEHKINMFEMVIGEIEPILGCLGEEREFEEVVMEIWLKSNDREEAQSGFEDLGQQLVKAKADYLQSRDLDKEIFGEDYEV